MRITLLLILGLTIAACEKMEHPSAFGTLERDRITLSATANEIILSHSVPEGAQVKKGDLLLTLDSTLESERAKQMQAEHARLEASLNFYKNGSRQEQIASAKARVQQAKMRLDNSQRELQRRESLRKQSLISDAELEQAKLQSDLAKSQLDDNQQQFHELQTGSREEIIQQAEAALKNAAALLAQEQKKLDDLQIRATRDGVLEDFPYEVGERVPMGAIVAIVAADSIPYARLSLPETSLAQYKVNDKVDIFIDGIEKSFSGKIRFISPRPFFTPYFSLHQSERARLMYKLEVNLQDAQQLPTGIPLHMELK